MTLQKLVKYFLFAVVAELIALILGWGTAFTFSSTVLVPWLGVSAAYAKLAAFLLSFMFTGVCFWIVIIVLGLIIGSLGFTLSGKKKVRR